MSDNAVEGKKVCKLIYVAVNDGKTKQSNKFYNMYEQGDGTFVAEWGRVEGRSDTKVYPMDKWDKTIKAKTKKGYQDVTDLFAEVVENGDGDNTLADISDRAIRQLMDLLQNYANDSIAANYTVSSKAVTQKQVDSAQAKLDEIVELAKKGKSIAKLDEALLELFHIIPRKMKDVRHHLFGDDEKPNAKITAGILDDIQEAIADEQATLDVMAGQVMINEETDEATEDRETTQTLLEMLGLEVTKAPKDQIDYVKDKMGPNRNQVRNVYMVVNKATQRKFDAHLDNAKDKHTRHFFHGSRNQNWLNIMSTGLLIRPAGAIHTGSMFGDGIYFADKAQKSIGYTSLSGSYWARGGDSRGFLALFHVHTGKWKKIRRAAPSLNGPQIAREGYDSVFAEGGADLRNNEYIVYNSNQCTISHLIEIA